MADIRMSLADAAMVLGIAPNSVRSRFKAGKLRGERDNQGKIWVWLDDAAQPAVGSKPKPSKPSIDRPDALGDGDLRRAHQCTGLG